jgi:hypothetical protein
VHIGNSVNWIQKIVLHLTCNGQLKALAVVLKYRPFVVVEMKDGVAVSTVCLLVCLLPLFNQSTLPADIISVEMEGEMNFCFNE